MATLMKANGEAYPITPKNGSDFTLEECYKAIDTDAVEIGRTNDDRIMIMDEEGKNKGKPYNPSGTALMRGRIGDLDFIVGDVIVCDPNEFN